MNETTTFDDREVQELASEQELRTILESLTRPWTRHVTEDLFALRRHLRTLQASDGPPALRADVLDTLYRRSNAVVTQAAATLEDIALPLARKTRELVRNMQDLLEALVQALQATPDETAQAATPPPTHTLLAWRTINALAQHLSISHLVAAPAGTGIWRQIHQAWSNALSQQAASYVPEGEVDSVQHIYLSALLLGCAQPDSFTAREITFLAAYLQRFAHCVEPPSETVPGNASCFWIDLQRDSPAAPCTRKPAPPEATIRYLDCEPIANLLNKQIDELNSGVTPQQINLPDFAGTPAGRGVMTRLAGHWGNPGKRRFPHRRRNHRAEICSGLHRLWLLFQMGEPNKPEVSTWMITNQSPDGYAIMHIGGKTGKVAVGDITAIRSESENGWQVCLVRWALSENPEHLEMGLQILSPEAIPAIITLPAEQDISERLPVLLLPAIPALGSSEVLVTTSGALNNRGKKHVLIVDRENLKVREIRTTLVEEQTSSVEVFAIETDKTP